MTNKIKNLLLSATIIVSVSCSPSLTSLKTSSDYNKTTDFSAYKTYRLDKIDTGSVGEQNAGYLAQSVKTQLNKKGFSENSLHPDLLVTVRAVVKPQQKTVSKTSLGTGGSDLRTVVYWSQYNDPALKTTVTDPKIKDGSLVITLTDAKSRAKIWEGTVTGEIRNTNQKPEEVINITVARILEELPAGS